MPENEEVGDSFHEESNLIYCYVEDLLYMNIWEWLQKGKWQRVHDYVKERPSDSTYQFCETMLDKILDITGYLCGHRIGSLLQKNRLKSDYKWVFVAYQVLGLQMGSFKATSNSTSTVSFPNTFLGTNMPLTAIHVLKMGTLIFFKDCLQNCHYFLNPQEGFIMRRNIILTSK
jgi:hypothetical protein